VFIFNNINIQGLMKRDLLAELKAWRKKDAHLPILLRGARQVGKTYLVEQFGKKFFSNTVTINFEESPEYIACFESFKPIEIINKIEIISKQAITPGQTLLFLDEIQACPNAIIALRYFKEKMEKQHLIGAGSLLEFALEEKGMDMPVGRVQYLYLKPLSFREFLAATDNQKLLDYFDTVTFNTTIPLAIHEQALKLVRQYMVIGGMPMVMASYLNDSSYRQCQQYQTMLLRTYSDDFSKYSTTAQHKYLQQVYDKTPGLVGQQIKYAHISPEMESRYLKKAVLDLNKAGVVTPVYSTSASGLPLITHVNEKRFKLLFLDIGLLKRATKLDVEVLFNEDLILLNRGAIAEQFVGQELLAYQDPYDEPQLYYWSREEKSSQAEVDYVININSTILPIEVKSGKTGTLKSLHLFIQEKKLNIGIRISSNPLQLHDNILSIPFYLIHQLKRLITTLKQKE
jgi:predicted AAA+ superfamily ATPase